MILKSMEIHNMIYFIFIGFLLTTPAAIAANIVPDTMAERVKACTICHGDEEKVEQHAYYPSINGKPKGYLFNQLRNFRDGRRHYQPMAVLLENMSDSYLMEIAYYFSALQLPVSPSEQIEMESNEIRLAEQLIFSGFADRNIPACSACHGIDLMGTAPFIPGLLGLSRTYITAQFGSWRNGGLIRGQVSDCMSEIAKKLTDSETIAIAKWLATQSVSGKPDPADTLSPELAHRCNSIVVGDTKK
ncbi:hypothetical protein C8R11_1321 [Nitrosomonas aestuarii]|nr:hypothetical protein C8R11_1321 [Nitrosomonas aestuarii]